MKTLDLLDPRIHIIPDQKDLDRAEGLKNKSTAQKEAFINKIKDPNKLARRGVALTLLNKMSTDYETKMRLNGLADKDLYHKFEETCKFITDRYWKAWHEYIHTLQMKRFDEAKKLADKINKRVPEADACVSTMCHHAYWNADGIFIDIRGFLGDDTPYSGYTQGGPSPITTYRKSYLGNNLSKIATVVKNAGFNLFKDYNNFFVMLSIQNLKREHPFKYEG